MSRVPQIGFLCIPLDYQASWQPAPREQYILPLKGRVEVEVSNGEKRSFEPGQPVLCELLIYAATGNWYKPLQCNSHRY